MSAHLTCADPTQGFVVDFPPAFGYDHLSILLGRTVGSLQRDRCRKPWTLPPACTPPGTKAPRWLLADVLIWLAQHRESEARQRVLSSAPGRRVKAEEIAPRRGAPTKAERIRRREAEASAAQRGG